MEQSAWQSKRIRKKQESNVISQLNAQTEPGVIDSLPNITETRSNVLDKVEVVKSPLRAKHSDATSNPFDDEQDTYAGDRDVDGSNQIEKYGSKNDHHSGAFSANGVRTPEALSMMKTQQTNVADPICSRSSNRYALPTSSKIRGQSYSEDAKTASLRPVSVEDNHTDFRGNRIQYSDDIPDVEYSNNEQSFETGIIVSKRESSRTIDDATDKSEYGGQYGNSDSVNLMYHKNRMSEPWLYTALLVHVIQFAVLLILGNEALPTGAMVILVLFVVLVAGLLLYSRKLVRKNRRRAGTILFRKKIESRPQCTPDEEADLIPQGAIYSLALAAILEGCTFALYTVVMAGRDNVISDHRRSVILETLRFASITLLAFHRILRPANRVDPMRTMLELEVVCVCWDALDGSTLYQLLSQQQLPYREDLAARVMMAFWYLSVGCRMAFMMMSHLSPSDKLYRMVLSPPLSLAPQPTVDRTLQSLRLRSEVILVMGAAELFAASLRISLWKDGYFRNDTLQQEMTIKNVLFLGSVYGAYSMWTTSAERSWNSPELGFGIRYPSRDTQREFFRWMFIFSYLLQGALFSAVLVSVSADKTRWVVNVGFDIVLIIIFTIYFHSVHNQNSDSITRCFLLPQRSYVVFPSRKALVINIVLAINMYAGRLPALYYTYNKMLIHNEVLTGWLNYDNVLLIVSFSVLPIAFAAMYWSISFMLFRREFTACPGNYNAIHDPTIGMVSTATMIEGSLDVLSCSTLMALAAADLPTSVNAAIIIFSLLELVNACQSFALQALLSGGHDDTPLDLVKWKAYLRVARGVIDLGAFILRLVLWIKYGSVSSVFLIKNLYNLLHTASQIERWSGVWRYPKHTLFTEFVSPADWYGMTKEEWRIATSNTLVAQARAGRRV